MDAQPLYQIIDQRPDTLRTQDGTYTPAYRVDFKVATGQVSHVFVPRSDYSPESVHAAVEDEARRIVETMTRPVTAQHIPPVS